MSNTPPGLHLSSGEAHCGNCVFAGGNGTVCTLHGNYPVEPNLVCSDYQPAPGAEQTSSDPEAA